MLILFLNLNFNFFYFSIIIFFFSLIKKNWIILDCLSFKLLKVLYLFSYNGHIFSKDRIKIVSLYRNCLSFNMLNFLFKINFWNYFKLTHLGHIACYRCSWLRCSCEWSSRLRDNGYWASWYVFLNWRSFDSCSCCTIV